MVLLQLLIVGWLPGAALYRVPFLNRDRRAALAPEERLFWAVLLSLAMSTAIVLALASIHRYSFGRLLIADGLIAVLALAFAGSRARFGPAAAPLRLTVLVPIAIVALGAWRYFPPAEYIVGGKDPGVYVNEGIQIAQRGTLVYADPVLASVPPFARDLFEPNYNQVGYYSIRFMGFFIRDPDRGTVVGQFPHLFPASIAIGYGVHGLSGALEAVGIWAILGTLAVYFLTARFAGWPAGAAAALLLACNVIQVWFARYPNSEMAMQALGFAALLANARAQADDDAFFAPVAGVLAGLLLFIRAEAVLIVGAIVAAQLLGIAIGQRFRWSFWTPLVVLTGLWFAYLAGPLRPYGEVFRAFALFLPRWQIAAAVAGAAAVLVMAAVARRSPTIGQAIRRWLPPLFNVALIALALYALLLRHPGGSLAAHDAYALRTFTSYYFTLPAFVAAMIGLLIAGRGLFWRDAGFMLALAISSIFLFYKIKIVPEHYWMARRFLSVILPGGLVLVATAALAGVRGRAWSTRALRLPVGIAFIALLAFSYARAAAPILHHVEYAGVVPAVERLASAIARDDLVIVESRNASELHILALPLADIYDKQVLVLTSPVPDIATFGAFLDREQVRHSRILFLGSGGTDLVSPRWSTTPIASARFAVPEYESTRDRLPRAPRDKKFDYTLYEFGPPHPPVDGFDLDVGANDDVNLVRFQAKEVTDGETFRWTRARSYLWLPRVDSGARTITLWMNNGGRPAAAPDATVSLKLGDVPLGSATVTGRGFAPYQFSIPPEAAAAAAAARAPQQVTIETVTWNPLRVLGTPDDRDLGVMVDRVTVK